MPGGAKANPAAVDDPANYLRPGRAVDSDHPQVVRYARDAAAGAQGATAQAVALYYAIRDDFRYDPYRVELTDVGMRASTVLARGYGFCITKAALLAACCRVLEIPARLGFADVRNHLATQKLLDLLGTDLFVFHGYADLFLDGRWVKATPAFNLSLCEKFGVLPLEFDGASDSVFHPYDREGRRHMEYVADRGVYADVPVQEIRDSFASTYANWVTDDSGSADSFEQEAAAESPGG
jgi:transglutaminase-like putative cysteine protease